MNGLRRFVEPPPARPVVTEERCDLCGVAVRGGHGHVAQLDRRALLCTCRACYLLFSRDGAGGGRLRSVPERYLADPGRRLAVADWDDLRIPVTTAFFFLNGDLGRVIACYPSPAGATESLLELESWDRLRRTYPLLALPVPDVEAVYVTDVRARNERGGGDQRTPVTDVRARNERGGGDQRTPVTDVRAGNERGGGDQRLRVTSGLETFLVPIDACFGLVGRVRAGWRGLDGGADVRRTLVAFADELRRRCRPIGDRQV
jgi:hypothetical protein